MSSFFFCQIRGWREKVDAVMEGFQETHFPELASHLAVKRHQGELLLHAKKHAGLCSAFNVCTLSHSWRATELSIRRLSQTSHLLSITAPSLPFPASNSLHHTLPLSPTYRWWAHLCGCLSHLTTRLRSWWKHGGEENLIRKRWNKKHCVDVGDVITEPSWARQADNKLRPPARNDSLQHLTKRMDSHYTTLDWMWKCDVWSGNGGCSWWTCKNKSVLKTCYSSCSVTLKVSATYNSLLCYARVKVYVQIKE